MKKYAVSKLYTLGSFDIFSYEFARTVSASLYSYNGIEHIDFLNLYELKDTVLIETTDEELKPKIGMFLDCPPVSEGDLFEAEDDDTAKLIFEVER